MTVPILLPVGAPPSEAKLAVAQQQAQALQAPLVLLHVLSPTARQGAAVSSAEAMARASLDDLAARLRGGGATCDTLVRSGQPAALIVEVAGALRVQLILLGSTVRGRFSRVLLSSVADAVIRAAPCPVLLVRTTMPVQASPPLLILDPPEVLAPRDLGVRQIELSRIVGSATRGHELNARFRLLHTTPADEERFEQLLRACARGDDLPPVELYKYGFGYYVRDGHHRVAAALALRRPEIAAKVTELIPLHSDAVAQAAAARQQFEQRTGVERIGAARAESYQRLIEDIVAYQQDQGLVDLPEAARRWFETDYQPLRHRVRTEGQALLRPGERPADVIARAAAWRRAAAARREGMPTWDEALRRLAVEADAAAPGAAPS